MLLLEITDTDTLELAWEFEGEQNFQVWNRVCWNCWWFHRNRARVLSNTGSSMCYLHLKFAIHSWHIPS